MQTLVLVGTVVPATTQLNTVAISTLVSLFVPLLVSVVTKQSASDGLKAVVNMVMVALTAVVTLAVTPGFSEITLSLVINTFVLSLVASITAYKGVWKPTGVAGTVAAKLPDVGIGSPVVVEPEATDEAGQIEATVLPEHDGTIDEYVTDPNYDPANDAVDPETQGEAVSTGAPGVMGVPFSGGDGTTPPEVKSP